MSIYHGTEECEIRLYSPCGRYAVVRWLRSGTLRTTAIANLIIR